MFSDILVSPVKYYHWENLCKTSEYVIRQHSDGKLHDTDKEYEQTMKLRNLTSLELVFKSLPEENEYI